MPAFGHPVRLLVRHIDEQALDTLREQASERRAVFVARAGPETTAQAGQRREIFVDGRKLYFFDPTSGDSIVGERSVAQVGAGGA